MIYVEAPDGWINNGRVPSVFLAGGITAVEDWQLPAREMFAERLAEVVVFNPRRSSFDIGNVAESDWQIEWEHWRLHETDVTLFWLPKCDPEKSVQPITLFELGRSVAKRSPIAVGIDPGFPLAQDIRLRLALERPSLPVHTTLTATVDAAVQLLRRPS